MSAAAAAKQSYRMKDLCELTGLTRQAIHFYVQQGLVPPGRKTGRNMAYYSDEHVERLRLIQRLQHEQFLPLKAIKAILDGETGGFDSGQRNLLRQVKQRLVGPLAETSASELVDALPLAERAGVSRDELAEMAEKGFIAATGDGDALQVRSQDAWLIELWGQLRRAGFTAELGFDVEDLGIYEQLIDGMFEQERHMLFERLSHLPPDRVAQMIEKVLPLLHTFLINYHTARVRDFFAASE